MWHTKALEIDSPFIIPVDSECDSKVVCPSCYLVSNLQLAIFQIFWRNLVHWHVLAQGRTPFEMVRMCSLRSLRSLAIQYLIPKSCVSNCIKQNGAAYLMVGLSAFSWFHTRSISSALYISNVSSCKEFTFSFTYILTFKLQSNSWQKKKKVNRLFVYMHIFQWILIFESQ